MNPYSEQSSALPSESYFDTTFKVVIKRNTLGLGLSARVGPDSLIRVKRVFPLQPAWQTGLIRAGDILLKAGDHELRGLSLRRALDILRTSPDIVTLTVCRPPSEHAYSGEFVDDPDHPHSLSSTFIRSYSLSTEAVAVPVPESQESSLPRTGHSFVKNAPSHTSNNYNKKKKYGQLVVELSKVNGGLGFTLSRMTAEQNTVLRHTVKALVKEPALSDGRIQPGDKLIAANGVDCDTLSHEELIQYLRSCPEKVTLCLYRDASRSQTPVSPDRLGQPTDFQSDNAVHRSRQLRIEAKEMVRSLHASRSSLDSFGSSTSAGSLGLGMRQRRGLSPHPWKKKPSTSLDSQEPPTVEIPLSPTEEATSLPPFMMATTIETFGGLRIEELAPATEEDE